MSEESIYLIDGHSQLFKAFFAIRGLTSPAGMPTNAVFGFAQIINRIIEEFSPKRLCVCFDLPGPTFRNDIYPDYKAHRPPAPEDLNIQTPHAKRFVVARGVRSAEAPGFESDDILTTLARQAARRGVHAHIVTADKDLLQVVGDLVSVIRIDKNRFVKITAKEVEAEWGAPPALMADLQALVGDSSDNIPGVPGVGPKTAARLLAGYASLEDLLAHTDQIGNPRQRGLLEQHADAARLSKTLATLRDDVPLDFSIDDCAFHDRPSAALVAFYAEMGFTRLRDAAARALGTSAPADDAPDLFAAPAATVSAPVDDGAPAAAAQSVQAPGTRVEIPWTRAELQALALKIRKAGRFAFDTETTSTDPLRAVLVGISLSWAPGEAAYIPVGHEPIMAEKPQPELADVRDALAPLLADEGLERIAQNAKYDCHVLGRHGMPVGRVAFDPMIASYLLDPDAQHGLKAMARQWLGVAMTPISDLIGEGRGRKTMDQVRVGEAADYAGADADLTLRLAEPMRRALDEAGLTPMLDDIEMPLTRVLERMERVGVRIDSAHFTRLAGEVDARLEELKREAWTLAGSQFNPDSPQQLAKTLFEDLKLPAGKRGQTGLSTDVSVLEELASLHPLPKLMLDYRAHKKLKSTYIDALPKLAHPETGRLHTSFNQTVAATGRLSSSDPNLQNIPVRTALGRKVREGFLPSETGRALIAADYSQIELRILAHVTREPALIDAFTRDLDIHSQTATRIFGVDLKAVTEDMRAQAKTVNFGVIYGMSAMRLSRQLSISMGKAAAFIRDYFAAYPGVREWTRRVVEEARQNGYVTTLSGRRRRLPDLASKSPAIRAAAERVAVNTPIQGTAADMIKIAMLRLDRRRDELEGAEMILQVHDELIFDAPLAAAPRVAKIVAEEMRAALPLEVPLKVDIKIGSNWAEC